MDISKPFYFLATPKIETSQQIGFVILYADFPTLWEYLYRFLIEGNSEYAHSITHLENVLLDRRGERYTIQHYKQQVQ